MYTKNKRTGIIGAGSWLVDHIKTIDNYPQQDALASIKDESLNNGGSPLNVLKDLARMGADFPLKANGIIGNDFNGEWIKNECLKYGINISDLKTVHNAPTAYSDVMTVESTGRRTFFHQRGANALLDIEHFNFEQSEEKMFHLGYLLLLDKLDEIHSDNLTGAAKVLRSAQEAGLFTSVDLVSVNSDRFKSVLIPAFPFVNYLFMNEFEAEKTTGIKLNVDTPDIISLRQAAKKLLDWGVQSWAFIHFPLGVYAQSKDGEEILQGSVKYPKEKIKSVVGAGDAFAAGVLFGLHTEWEMDKILKLGVATAAASLQDVSCSDGVENYMDCLEIADKYSYHKI